jgi:hypothetical protein
MASSVQTHLAVLASGLASLAGGYGGVALVFGVAAVRLRRAVGAEAIQEHGMALEDLCAALMRPRLTLVCPVRALLCLRTTVA